ncbi:hypothetical protein EOI86_02150 [Hwanghaeella grinnelliae]|uniref:Uncharacterized protein n=1 Tax=Hwanghaeella grinnelliae TaxID=2500179 RepID=A0A3S2Z8Z2_9PROT|nr:hypothetical protein [Hwanghaeella grinnelliae]RVU38128.1 hypothetical protein EOI86_02150 [Hwanghaeella grinnelliae]
MTEKELDRVLERGFKELPGFCDWFLSRTRFSDRGGRCVFSRSDHPWGRFPVEFTDPETGRNEEVLREGETDVLVVFEASDGMIFALHIENKLADGKFTAFQPELYAARAKHWLHDVKYGRYQDFQTVLVSPSTFRKKNVRESGKFDCFVSHEDIAKFLPEFGSE